MIVQNIAKIASLLFIGMVIVSHAPPMVLADQIHTLVTLTISHSYTGAMVPVSGDRVQRWDGDRWSSTFSLPVRIWAEKDVIVTSHGSGVISTTGWVNSGSWQASQISLLSGNSSASIRLDMDHQSEWYQTEPLIVQFDTQAPPAVSLLSPLA